LEPPFQKITTKTKISNHFNQNLLTTTKKRHRILQNLIFCVQNEEELDPEDIEDEQYTLETRSKCKEQEEIAELIFSQHDFMSFASIHHFCVLLVDFLRPKIILQLNFDAFFNFIIFCNIFFVLFFYVSSHTLHVVCVFLCFPL